MLIAFAELRLVHNIAKRALLNQSKHAFCLTNQERNKANCDLASALFPALSVTGMLPALSIPALGFGCMFSRAWHGLHVSTPSSDWVIMLRAFAAIGQRNNFDFGSTTDIRQFLK